MGKGSWIRRRQVDYKTWSDNWENALGKKSFGSAPENEPTPCDRCHGKGTVVVAIRDDSRTHDGDAEVTCDKCDGSGIMMDGDGSDG